MHAGEPLFLRVKNFERMQHYTNRRPPWIKFYVDLLRDHELGALPKEARLLYCLLLLVAAKEDNHIANNAPWISGEVLMPLGPVRKGILVLLESGHLQAAGDEDLLANPSRNGDSPHARARSLETEKETEKEKEKEKPLAPPAREATTRPPDPLWDVFVVELGEPQTSSERGRRNKALKELRAVGATDVQLRSAVKVYRHKFPGAELTATAITGNWTLLTDGDRDPADYWKQHFARRNG